MCELFGFNGSTYVELTPLLKEFYSHSIRQPHGWGLAIMNGKYSNVEKESMPAYESDYLKERLLEQIYAKNALAHIRYATMGELKRKNCNPYRWQDRYGRTWTMVHNGTIFDFEPMNRFKKTQEGETDSERVLLYIVDRINHKELEMGRELNEKERFDLLDEIVCLLSKGNKLNLMIYDGDTYYAHTNEKNTLHVWQTHKGAYFSTKPLHVGNWQDVPLLQLQGYQNGQLKYVGTKHTHEYIFNPDHFKSMKFDYLEYANL